MSDDEIPVSLLIDAVIRRCDVLFLPIYVIQKGNYASGTIMLKLNGLGNGINVLIQERDMDGELGWVNVFENHDIEESKADNYIKKAISRDSDLWVLEIEDKNLKNPFEA